MPVFSIACQSQRVVPALVLFSSRSPPQSSSSSSGSAASTSRAA
eukprot:CAMPEP_0205919794 /NCGR_PEP_ID=MMETSP1325-20131115/10667_1 /ASSEMBLY_ACC=CAM_ASM_000708 /TAXON_ID=236786 /ORGANISM="Florenciella sp., Strain RCC1007" /LENGTH=43 /DNA_ID= /DNA_START= /DNA_END= /DNA_ORIENTATION=